MSEHEASEDERMKAASTVPVDEICAQPVCQRVVYAEAVVGRQQLAGRVEVRPQPVAAAVEHADPLPLRIVHIVCRESRLLKPKEGQN